MKPKTKERHATQSPKNPYPQNSTPTLHRPDLLKSSITPLMHSTSARQGRFFDCSRVGAIPDPSIATRFSKCGRHHSHGNALANALRISTPASVTAPAISSDVRSNCPSTFQYHMQGRKKIAHSMPHQLRIAYSWPGRKTDGQASCVLHCLQYKRSACSYFRLNTRASCSRTGWIFSCQGKVCPALFPVQKRA